MTAFLARNLDLLAFAFAMLLVVLAVHRLALRRIGVDPSGTWHRVSYVVLLVAAWMLVHRAETEEINRRNAAVMGPLTTYAAEMQRLGHWQLGVHTPPGDPAYQRMIEAEKRWLRVNPDICDIFTVRRQEDGRMIYVVDAESEVMMAGDSKKGRDSRTPIGERLTVDLPSIERAYSGDRFVNADLVTDRWGTWVAAYAPIRDEEGKIEAVLGVHADAQNWMDAVSTARLTMLLWIAGGFCAAGIAAIALSLRTLARENHRQRQATCQIEQSRSRLSSIMNSIDGVVWEWDVRHSHYAFVSKQSTEVLGIEPQQLEANAILWTNHVHPDDLAAAEVQRQSAIENGTNYSVDYRFQRDSGITIWVRERGVCLRDASDKPVSLRGIFVDITESRLHAEELESLNKQLIEASRQAGMAEVASGVLHNVGNVLNSVNVSASMISDIVRESKVRTLTKFAELLNAHESDLIEFLAQDVRGQAVPKFVSQLAKELSTEQQVILKEMSGLVKNVTHIKQIVMMQQSFARTGGSTEPADVIELVEDSLRINESSLVRHGVQLVRDFYEVPTVLVDRNKVLQILVNLVRNAKHAVQDEPDHEHRITVTVKPGSSGKVAITVADNGIGMAPETLKKLFSYGFTTKKNGHGFGLHSGANAAREMGGSLTGHSDGHGKGAAFTLEVPVLQNTTLLPTLPALDGAAPSTAERPRTRPFTRPLKKAEQPDLITAS